MTTFIFITLAFIAGFLVNYFVRTSPPLSDVIYDKINTIDNKSKLISNIYIYMHDDPFTSMKLDNKHIIEFNTWHSNNINQSNFYYSLFNNKQMINILYENNEYQAYVSCIKMLDDTTLSVYYHVVSSTEGYIEEQTVTVRAKDGSYESTYTINE